MVSRIKHRIQKIIKFLSYDIWRIDKDSTSSSKLSLYNVIKSFILAFRNINASQLNTRASSLTYSTLLSMVPLLAILFAIARGFGFQNIVKSELFHYFEGQQTALEKAMQFVDESLKYASGGVFVGVGIIMLLYTVISLMSNIEENFNNIWRVSQGRSYYRQFTDYMALFLIAPVFLICNSGLTIFLNSSLDIDFIGFFISPVVKFIPFVITILLFTFFYVYIPNTKVKFTSALFGGFFAGLAFQLFQIIYISGQIWISKYNAIYGSFAALPLLLLWLQLSWLICLIGAELSFASQNIEKYSFEREINNISRRYKDFLVLLLSTLIVKRFEIGGMPYTANELSATYKIPTKLTNDTLTFLHKIGIIVSTPTHDDLVPAYIPAIDINKITVNYLFEKADLYGSEDFKIDVTDKFNAEWKVVSDLRTVNENRNALLKDLSMSVL
ncbi:YihY/virulence factor BrkB family protein [Dysgonomonas sp. 216]|uniref:YihY/virulence factor BrkB family protein n=1 Tax=Dysgonomonas sp. 216 TaxID=2302934 RepID=UPI0013D14D68|nr:YihY/virulence factor BrkB family protein [Dysgonomonas sp. 216]NDW17724.1 YihY/virulence factor BrkB family protein [Dysgonomonas sp. 216]